MNSVWTIYTDEEKRLSSLNRDLTKFLTDGDLSNLWVLKDHWDKKIKDLLQDKKLSIFTQIVNTNDNHDITLHESIKNLQKDCLTVFQNEDYKKWYTQQLVIGMARLEWIAENVIEKIYWKYVEIHEEMQDVFKKNNLTLMDLTTKEVVFEQKEKELFLYTMLFLHDWEDKNTDKAKESWYYKVDEGKIEFKEYWIKSFEQAFNCGWQIYNEFFWSKEDKKNLPHHPINSVDDIYSLYDTKTSLNYNWKIIDSHTLAWILNITRALLHVQAHKHLDYIRWEKHDPASFIKYKQWKHWKEIYWTQIDEVRDWEIESLWRTEISHLGLLDKNWKTIIERSPSIYDGDTKSWHLKDTIFNDVKTTFSWRSKWLTSRIMKLINDPRYKKWKDVTDSLWNSFYVENKEAWLKVWLWLIEKLPEKLIDGARLDIKWSESWDVLMKEIANDGTLLDPEAIKENLSCYGISKNKVSLLLRNKWFNKQLHERLNNTNNLKNDKTVQWYEEFKIVTTTGTEYQISEKSNDMIVSKNEFGLWNHGIYNIKKLMELLLRPDNHTMVLWHNTIENIINNALDEEEFYLQERAKKMWLIDDNNIHQFNPRYAIWNQLLYDDIIENDNIVENDDKMHIDSTQLEKIKEDREKLFFWEKDNSRAFVKEFIYNMIQKEYVGYLKSRSTYALAKPLWNQRSIVSQLLWYRLYQDQLKKLPKESS
jgi:hypothetical protein